MNGAKLTIYNDELVDSNYYSGSSLIHREAAGQRAGSGERAESGHGNLHRRHSSLAPGTWTELGLEVVQDESLPGNRVARGADRLVVSEVEAELAGRKLTFALATSNVIAKTLARVSSDGGDRRRSEDRLGASRALATIAICFSRCASPSQFAPSAGAVMTVRLRQDSEYRRATHRQVPAGADSSAQYSWAAPLNPRPIKKTEKDEGPQVNRGLAPSLLEGAGEAADKRTEEQKEEIFDYFEWASPELQPLLAEVSPARSGDRGAARLRFHGSW